MKYPVVVLWAAAVSTTYAQTILDVVVGSPDHSLLSGAISVASPEFVELFSNPNVSLTLFAPDNAAIASVDQEYMQLLYTPPWINHLSCVLLGHVYGGALASTDITGPITVNSAMPGFQLNITGPDPVTVNDIPVSIPDIVASNGFIHSLSTGVLLPTCVTQDLDDTMASGALSTLMVLVGLIRSPGLESFRDTLKQPATADGLTMFAPTDAAFANLDPLLLEQLASDPELLTQVLSYHVIPGNYNGNWSGTFDTMLAGETVNLTLLPGEAEEVEADDVLMINDAATATNSSLASNGVIIEIDTVLLPSTLQTELDLNATLMPAAVPPPLFPTAVPPPTFSTEPPPTMPQPPLFPTTFPPPTTSVSLPPTTPDLPLEPPPIHTGIPEEEDQEEEEEEENLVDDPPSPPDDVPTSSSPGEGKGGYNPPASKGKGMGYYYHSHGHGGGHYHPVVPGNGGGGDIFQKPMNMPTRRYYYKGYRSGSSGSMMKSGSMMNSVSYGMSGKGGKGGGSGGYYGRVHSKK